MDRVQLPQGYSHFEEAVYFLPSGFEQGTPGLGIQCLNHLAIAP